MKSDFLTSLKEVDNYTFTENGAVSLKSTGNKVLDAFGSLGAMKNSHESVILDTFYQAFYENKELAMKLLFYIRDIRGGQGMRRIFRIIARSLSFTNPEMIKNNLDNFLFFGRGDDYLCLMDTPCEEAMLVYLKDVLVEDLESVLKGNGCTLLAKWMPSENTSSSESVRMARKIRKAFCMDAKSYRKMLSTLRAEIGIVEAKMSANKWDEIEFEKLPSRAALQYADAFVKHCTDNYIKYLTLVAEGKANINAGALFPVDIIKKVRENCYAASLKDKLLYDAMWKALPNFFEGTEETGICMCDTSGSMSGEPLLVSLSLGLYCADKCKGPFKDYFITFSERPELRHITGNNIFEKVNSIGCINPLNTDFEKALQLILDAAIKHNSPQTDLPSKLYVISDMQFDEATGEKVGSWYGYKRKTPFVPFMQTMKRKYAEAGYAMPAIVYWNVRASNCGMFHETVDGEDCCMVSGYSPSLFKAVIDGTDYVEEVNSDTGEVEVKQKIDPMTVMLRTLNNDRYSRVFFG